MEIVRLRTRSRVGAGVVRSPEKLCLATCLIFLPVRVRCLICLSLKPCNENKYYFFRPQVGGWGI